MPRYINHHPQAKNECREITQTNTASKHLFRHSSQQSCDPFGQRHGSVALATRIAALGTTVDQSLHAILSFDHLLWKFSRNCILSKQILVSQRFNRLTDFVEFLSVFHGLTDIIMMGRTKRAQTIWRQKSEEK